MIKKDEKENELISEMEQLLEYKLIRDYPPHKIKRATHPKGLGLVKAKFLISHDLDEKYKKGIFKGQEYNCWIRFSNARGNSQSDTIKDYRGMSLKILDVKGDRQQNGKNSFDILLQSHPTMALGTIKDFRDAMYYDIKKTRLHAALAFIFSGRGKLLKQFNAGRKLHSSPLDISYWSATPYSFGKLKVKYKVTPTSNYTSEIPKEISKNFLKENMEKHLSSFKATFDFKVQFFKDEKTTPLEDASIEWDQIKSPFVKLATIEIPIQKFNIPSRISLMEKIYFDPSNVTNEHKPIGGLNKARTIIYKKLADFRANENKLALIEPKFCDYE